MPPSDIAPVRAGAIDPPEDPPADACCSDFWLSSRVAAEPLADFPLEWRII